MQVTIPPAGPVQEMGLTADLPVVEQAFDIVLDAVAAMMPAARPVPQELAAAPAEGTGSEAPPQEVEQALLGLIFPSRLPVIETGEPVEELVADGDLPLPGEAGEVGPTDAAIAAAVVAEIPTAPRRHGSAQPSEQDRPDRPIPRPVPLSAGASTSAPGASADGRTAGTSPAVPEPGDAGGERQVTEARDNPAEPWPRVFAPRPEAPAATAGAAIDAAEADEPSPPSPRGAAGAPVTTQQMVQPAAVSRVAWPETRFVEQNHPTIVTAVRGQLFPNGGTMQIRLDPPQLGAIQVIVRLHDGVMQAAFHTSSDQATQLLGHTLGHLKTALESAGVTVDRLQVQQTLRNEPPTTRPGDQPHDQPRDQQQQSAQQDQQRRELIQRMWQKLALGEDPLDLVA